MLGFNILLGFTTKILLGFMTIILVSISKIRADVMTGNSTDLEDEFILIYDWDCKDDRNVIVALQESGFSSEIQIVNFEEKLNNLILLAKSRRLGTVEGTVDNVYNETNHVGRRLSEMSWKDRRDQVVSVLTLFVNERRQNLESIGSPNHSLKGSGSPSIKFLEHVGMEIVDDSQLSGGQLFKFAEHLPCLANKPERNKISYVLKSSLPNDFNSAIQWYMNDGPEGIGVTKAWDCYHGQQDGPVVAFEIRNAKADRFTTVLCCDYQVIDSGCSAHPDLEGNLCQPDEDCAGIDIVSGGSPFFEEIPHGTSVSGIIAAVGNNNIGISGICLGCKIMCIRISDSGGAVKSKSLIDAVDYILSKKTVKITNHSYVKYNGGSSEYWSFKRLEEAGIIVIAAAGNENCDLDSPYTKKCVDPKSNEELLLGIPAGYSFKNIISVGASTRDGMKAPFSNYGKKRVHLFAPGVQIASLCNRHIEKCKYGDFHGSSFAAPIVTGAVALLWGQDPSLTYKEVISIVFESVRKVAELDGGIIDVDAAMQLVGKRKKCSPTPLKSVPSPTIDNTRRYYPNDHVDSSVSPKIVTNIILLFSVQLLI